MSAPGKSLLESGSKTDWAPLQFQEERADAALEAVHGIAAPFLGREVGVTPTVHRSRTNIPAAVPQFAAPTIEIAPQKITFPLKPTQKKNLVRMVEREWTAIEKRKPTASIPVFHKSQHKKIFECTSFPGLVLILLGTKEADAMLTSLNMCQAVVAAHDNLTCCFVPLAESLLLENVPKTDGEAHRLVVMQKVEGIISSYAREESEKVYEQFDASPALKIQWQEFFRQAAEYICLTGYWDAYWNNILLMKSGFGFVDFDDIKPTDSKKQNGIKGLLRMAPPDFFDMIASIAEKHGVVEIDTQFGKSSIFDSFHTTEKDAAKQKRKTQLDLHSQVRQWHREKHITKAIPLELTAWPPDSWEYKMIAQFNEEVTANAELYEGCLILQRRMARFASPEEYYPIEKALANLKSSGMIYSWIYDYVFWIYF